MIVAKQARAFTAAVQTANQQSSGASSVNNRANGIGARHLAQQHQRENCGESASQIAAVSSVVAKNETRSERRQVAQEVANGRRKRREQEQEEGEGEEKEAAQQRQHHHYQDHQHEQSASAPSGSAVEVEAAVAEDLLLVEKNPDKQQSMLMHQQQVASECGRSDSASGSCACGDTNNKQVGRLNQQAAANMRQLNLGQSTLATSLKIQQKQQKFLAAAARSATSPTGAAAATVAVSSAKLSAAPSPPLPPQQAQQHSPAPNAGAMSSPAQNDIGNYNQLHQSKHQQQQQHPSRTMKLQAGGCCQVTACSSQATAAAPTATLSSSMVMMSSLHQPPNNAITPAQASRQTPQHQQQLQQPQTQTILQRQQSHPTVAHTLQRHPLNNSNIKNNNYNHNLSHQQPQQQPHQADLTSAQQQPPQTPTSQSQQHLQQYQQLHHNHNHQHHNQQQHQYHHYYHHHQDQQRQLQQQNMDHYKFHNDCQSSVLTYEQVKRLDFVMDQTVPIHGRGNFPTLYVKLKELIRLVKYKLQKEHLIEIRDIRLNGGAASYVLAPENSHYNDLDLIFGTDLSDESQFDVIRDVVLECLKEFLPHEHLDEEVQDNYNSSYLSSENNNPTLESKVTACSTDTNQAESGQADSGSFELVQSEFKDDAQVCKSEGDAARFVGDNEICGTSEGVQTGSASVGNRTQAHGEQANLKVIDEVTDLHQQQQQAKQSANAPTSFQYQHHQAYQMPLTNCAIKEAYVHKMVKVNDDDRWSLISLGVQQSEGNCCGPTTGCPPSPPSAVQLNTNNTSLQQPPHKQFSVTLTYENEPNGLTSQSIAPMGSIENHPVQAIASNNIQHQHQCHQVTYLHQQHKSQRNHYQQKQSPNSIELKFVDKMRRKFEFSVDSFQIILDSLIQFYDYAPQSTYTKLINSHPSSTMINTRPMINKRRCSECCSGRSTIDCKTNDNSGSLSNGSIVNKENFNYNNQHHQHHHNQHNHNHHNHHTTMNGFTGATKSLLNSSRSYYQLPIEPANSSSISSMASSSGCSSSSSVVSSSSSSLSCDEDHEDLDCEADGPSSSSASISSLLSSTTMSLLSSEGSACNGSNELEQRQKNRMTSKLHEQSNYKGTNRKGSGNGTGNSKILTPHHHNQSELGSTSPYKVETVECFEKHANANTYDFEMDFGSCAVISENFYPTVIGRSEYGNFKEALYHLERKLIATRSPEEIRGGGLLKYCNLLVKNYKPTNVYQIRTLERYMCSRFFIDFSDLNQQQAKLESYLANHFSDDPMLKFDYLTILHNVVQRSTVCLMNHELRLTLNMIRDLAHVVGSQQQQNQQQQQQQYHHHQQQRK